VTSILTLKEAEIPNVTQARIVAHDDTLVSAADGRYWKRVWGVLDMDIKGFFDEIDRELLMRAVNPTFRTTSHNSLIYKSYFLVTKFYEKLTLIYQYLN